MILDTEFRLLPWTPDPPESCDPLGTYAETYWLPVLQPAAWAMGRRLVTLQRRADGQLVLDADVLAAAIGLEDWRGRAFLSMDVLSDHRLVRCRGTANLEVRCSWPRLPNRYLRGLPVLMQRAEPDFWAMETPVVAGAVVPW